MGDRGSSVDASAAPFRTETASMGQSRINLDRALRVAADLEDDELLRRMRAGAETS